MAALHIILHSFPSHMHIFGAAFPLTRAVQRLSLSSFCFPEFFLFIPEVHMVVFVALSLF